MTTPEQIAAYLGTKSAAPILTQRQWQRGRNKGSSAYREATVREAIYREIMNDIAGVDHNSMDYNLWHVFNEAIGKEAERIRKGA